MVTDLRRDYQAMSGMIFGAVPPIDDVLASIAALEKTLNLVVTKDSPKAPTAVVS
jgi:hypothetical protein